MPKTLGLLKLLGLDYPESVAKRIESGELPMDPAARAARLEQLKQQGWRPSYHSTTQDWVNYDPDMVDIGLHSGTPEQADMRMRDLATAGGWAGRNRPAEQFPYDPGSMVLPLLIKAQNPLNMKDVGNWENSQAVAEAMMFMPEFRKDRPLLEDIYSSADEWMPYWQDEGYDRLSEVPENRAALDELRSLVLGKGYDSIRYLNEVENAYGKQSGYTRQAQQEADKLNARIAEINASVAARRPPLPSPDSPDFRPEMVTEWLNIKPQPSAAELAEQDRLRTRLRQIAEDPMSVNDPHSYISLEDGGIKSLLGALDLQYKGSNILGSRIAPTAGAGALGLMKLLDMYGEKPEDLR